MTVFEFRAHSSILREIKTPRGEMDKHVNVFSSRVQLNLATTVNHESSQRDLEEIRLLGAPSIYVFLRSLQNEEKIAHNFQLTVKSNFKTTI